MLLRRFKEVLWYTFGYGVMFFSGVHLHDAEEVKERRVMKKKVLFICGSMNQTTQMHQISGWMTDYDQYFSPFFSDGLLGISQ